MLDGSNATWTTPRRSRYAPSPRLNCIADELLRCYSNVRQWGRTKRLTGRLVELAGPSAYKTDFRIYGKHCPLSTHTVEGKEIVISSLVSGSFVFFTMRIVQHLIRRRCFLRALSFAREQ